MIGLRLAAFFAIVSVSFVARAQDLSAIAAMVRANRTDDALAALAALGGRAPLPAHYLRGKLLYARGNLAEAAQVLERDFAALPPAVAADARSLRAAALARSGHCDVARPLLLADARPIARARAAECALELRDFEVAERELTALASERAIDTFAVRAALADAKVGRGDTRGAIATLHALLVERPEHPAAEYAERRARELGDAMAFTTDERMTRAERFLAAKQPRDAIAELDHATRPDAREALDRYLHLRGAALFAARMYADAAPALRASAARHSSLSADDAYDAARALLRAGDPRGARTAYRAFLRANPDHASSADAELQSARIELASSHARGVRALERFIADHPRSARDLVREAMFELALDEYTRGRFREAAGRFTAYAAEHESAMVKARGLYWTGRARLDGGQRRPAIAAFREALAVEPLHYYASLAAQRLRELGEDPGDPFGAETAPSVADPALHVALPPVVELYRSLGLVRDARAALEENVATIRAGAPAARREETLVAAFLAVDDAASAHRLVASSAALSARPDPRSRWIWDAAYPRPFADEVERASRESHVPRALIYALMRKESAFDPEVVSYADAIGLLQLLERTGAEAAEKLGVAFRRELLFDPSVNVRLGAAYFASVRARLGDVDLLAVGAYNGGAGAMRRFLRESGPASFDLFVERIPYEQTRNYVRRVSSNYARYLYLEDPSRGFALTFPERVAPLD